MVPSNHLRSFCLSFLLLAFLLTAINFLTTTTTIHKLTIFDDLTDNNLTKKLVVNEMIPVLPILSLNPIEVHHNRFYCYRRSKHLSHRTKNISKRILRLDQPVEANMTVDTIPYDYSQWKSAPSMPRLVSECEHDLMMQLLTRFHQLTKKYSLEYMMIDGTLLGSWRHHDLIPWDDDVDLLMSVRDKDRLNEAIAKESLSSPYVIEFYRRWDAPKEFEYYKFYFSVSPRFSEYPWRYPFVDLIFYHENVTHIWQENMQNSTSISKKNIFPLQYRPFGRLWLPAPLSPHDYFMSVGWKTYDQDCFNADWSHKYETTKNVYDEAEWKSVINCQQLENFYPFVKRSLDLKEERLVIDGTVKQIFRQKISNKLLN